MVNERLIFMSCNTYKRKKDYSIMSRYTSFHLSITNQGIVVLTFKEIF